MFDDRDHDNNQLSSDIRQLIESGDSGRYLRSLPEFQVESGLPANLRLLLQSLDQTEKSSGPRRT